MNESTPLPKTTQTQRSRCKCEIGKAQQTLHCRYKVIKKRNSVFICNSIGVCCNFDRIFILHEMIKTSHPSALAVALTVKF